MTVPPPAMAMLPVADLDAAARFYYAVFAWTAQPIGPNALALTSGGSVSFVLITRDYLESESGIRSAAASLGAIHAVALISRAAVDAALARARAAGAAITSAARERDFSIYSAYFADPDGNGWEVLTNPPTA